MKLTAPVLIVCGLVAAAVTLRQAAPSQAITVCQIAERWYEGFQSTRDQFDSFEDFLSTGIRSDGIPSSGDLTEVDFFSIAIRYTNERVKIYDLEVGEYPKYSILRRLSASLAEWENHQEVICEGHKDEDNE